MQFEEHQFSKRFPKITAALFVIHEPIYLGCLGTKVNTDGSVDQKNLEPITGGHRGTAAAIILPDGRFWAGVALCSPADPYVKATGRQKALGRAFQALRAGQNGDGYVNEHGAVTIIEAINDTPLRHPIIGSVDDLKFRLHHEIALAKKKRQELMAR